MDGIAEDSKSFTQSALLYHILHAEKCILFRNVIIIKLSQLERSRSS